MDTILYYAGINTDVLKELPVSPLKEINRQVYVPSLEWECVGCRRKSAS